MFQDDGKWNFGRTRRLYLACDRNAGPIAFDAAETVNICKYFQIFTCINIGMCISGCFDP